MKLKWGFLIIIIFVSSLILFWVSNSECLKSASFWPVAIGWLYAVLVGYFAIEWISNMATKVLKQNQQEEDKKKKKFTLGDIVGCVERSLYLAAFWHCQVVFIGVWLGIKVLGEWKRWDVEKQGEWALNQTLIQSALSIAYAFVGWKLGIWMGERALWHIVLLPTALVVGSFVIWFWLSRKSSYYQTL